MIDHRLAEVEHRTRVGDCEGDLTGRLNQSAIATLVDRASRYVRLVALPEGHGAGAVRDGLSAHTPAELRSIKDRLNNRPRRPSPGAPHQNSSATL